MEYKSTNSGLLAPAMVKSGDKLIILEDAYSTFSEKQQKTYWNCKVVLPDGSHKLAGLMESACDAFAAKWGGDTKEWTGHVVEVEIKTSKAGNPYIWLKTTDDEKADVEKLKADKAKKDFDEIEARAKANGVDDKPSEDIPTIEYPTEEINPEDIPF